MEHRKNVHDKRNVKLENILRDDYIPFKGGRPNRTKIIGNDDITNLKIALNTSKSIEEFIQKV